MRDLKIKKGDTVKIIAGKDRGKTGAVLTAYPKEGRVTIDGLNLYKKRVRPKRARQKGEVVSVPRPLDISNVMLMCKNCKRPTRAGFRLEGVEKVRYCKKCQTPT